MFFSRAPSNFIFAVSGMELLQEQIFKDFQLTCESSPSGTDASHGLHTLDYHKMGAGAELGIAN